MAIAEIDEILQGRLPAPEGPEAERSPILANLKKLRLPEAAGEVRRAMLEAKSGIVQNLVVLMERSENDRVRAECAKTAIRELNRLCSEYEFVVNRVQFADDQRAAYASAEQADAGKSFNSLNSTKKENPAPETGPGRPEGTRAGETAILRSAQNDNRHEMVPPHSVARRADAPAGEAGRKRGSRRLN